MFNSKPVLETALAHRSIRKFSEQKIEPELLEHILHAGQMASTSSFLQSVSVIRVTDPAKREQLRQICADGSGGTMKHYYVVNCAEFLVFCADASRHRHFAPDAQLEWTEVLLTGAIDVGLFAQNVLLSAESVGLGGVFIGGLRNDMNQLAEILETPDEVIPLVGMCLGYPAQEPIQRPRLPLPNILSENTYRVASAEELAQYNQTVKQYYQERSGLDLDWQKQIQDTLCAENRPELLPFLQKRGFAKK